jgi:hypothetical protein
MQRIKKPTAKALINHTLGLHEDVMRKDSNTYVTQTKYNLSPITNLTKTLPLQ